MYSKPKYNMNIIKNSVRIIKVQKPFFMDFFPILFFDKMAPIIPAYLPVTK